MRVGKMNANPPNDLILGGRDVSLLHAELTNIDGKILLKPLAAKCHLYVNGKKVTDTVELVHLDRVIFGWNSVYLFKNKDDNRTDEKIKNQYIDW